MLSFLSAAAALLGLVDSVSAGSLADIDHVVLFMQENRAFDHYFGSMSGVRGFKDPNAKNRLGRSTLSQDVDSSLSNDTTHLLPWYLNYLGGEWPKATQCMIAGNNGWNDNHGALNDDLNNKWALNNTPWSVGYYKKADLPVHFGIAEGWTVGDMYQESVIASTNPNRVTWLSGSINAPGGPQTPDQGGPYIDNNETPGCETAGGQEINCYPLKWKTVPEFWEAAGVDWQTYQDTNNFDDQPLAYFLQYQNAGNESSLGRRAMSFLGLDAFYDAAKAGTLPAVSLIIGPAELSEHPPYMPNDGAWLQQQVVNAVVTGKNYAKTALLISYDETGGWGDHVIPYHSPKDTTGEWMTDPYGKNGDVYTGPGFRLPFYIVSPFTRGGHVFTERADHTSQIKFVEQWLKAKGKDVVTDQIPKWRREHMSDLVKAFDFNNPDYSIPNIPEANHPSVNANGDWDGYAVCEATYPSTRPPVPYGEQTAADSLFTESGFKSVRGLLTEGRYLTFEANGFALTAKGSFVTASKATVEHDSKAQRWIIHEVSDAGAGAASVAISSAVNGAYIGIGGRLTKSEQQAATFKIVDQGNGAGYTVQLAHGYNSYFSICEKGKVSFQGGKSSFKIYSVTY